MSKRKSVSKADAEVAKKLRAEEDATPAKLTVAQQKARALEWAKGTLSITPATDSVVDPKTPSPVKVRAASPAKTRASTKPKANSSPATVRPSTTRRSTARKTTVESKDTPAVRKPRVTKKKVIKEEEEEETEEVSVAEQKARAAQWAKTNLANAGTTRRTPTKKTLSVIKESAREVSAPPAPVPATTIVADVNRSDDFVGIWEHYWKALGCCVHTIVPVFACFSAVFYFAASATGFDENNDYAKCAMIIGVAYAAVLVFYLTTLLPLIIFTRSVDSALFTHGGSILTSSIVEISVLTLLVIGSLLFTSYSTRV